MCNIEKMGATCAISECKKTTAVVTQLGILAWHAHTLGPNPFCQNPMLIFLDLWYHKIFIRIDVSWIGLMLVFDRFVRDTVRLGDTEGLDSE